jgi:predicted RNase H-like HicB family nuclease
MSESGNVYTVRIHSEPDEDLWAEVEELPGCFASGQNLAELQEALAEAISLYLSEPGKPVRVELEEAPGSITERHILARTA